MKYDSFEDYAKGSKTGYMAKEFMSLLSKNQGPITNKWIEEGGNGSMLKLTEVLQRVSGYGFR